MNRQRFLTIIFIFSLMATSSGCTNRFVAGARKLFVTPAKHTVAGVRKIFNRSDAGVKEGEQTEPAYHNVKPVVTIEDGAGHTSESKAEAGGLEDVITPEQAATYRELVVTKPYDSIVRYNMGRLYLQQGLLEEATYELDMATSLDPKFTYAFILLGRALRMRGQYDLAMAKFTAAMQLSPDLPLTFIDAGVCWDQRGYHDRAREAYQKALALVPNTAGLGVGTAARIYNNIGYSFFLEENYGEAMKAYRLALQLNPDDQQTNNNMAMTSAMQQKWDKALHHFTVAVGLAAAQNNIGHLLLRAGKVDEALAHLELAVRLNPKSVRSLGNLESALRLKGRIDDAEKLHAQLVEIERSQTRPRNVSNAVNQ
jgi:Flp pilus assembly protein TadD